MYRKLYFYLFLSLLSFIAFSQEETFTKYKIGANQRIISSHWVTAIAIKSKAYLGEQIELEVNSEIIVIPFDPDSPDFSYFKSLSEPLKSVRIETELELEVGLINSGASPIVKSSKARIDQETCEFEIDPIPQSEWRAGLEPPSYSRSFTNVEHVIVHHAAGSNTNTNYTQVVRDIYIYHTQGNGWSDIGYNYLIAQNGDLYAGRDPAGGAQDNVLGAHFCGSNSTTMGVCLLGNYETVQPTASTMETLLTVAAFKTQKENLDPLTFESHPLGNIGHIAGHRDGCSTLCPGEYVYEKLHELRLETAEYLENCGNALSIEASELTIEAGESVQFTNTSSGYESFAWLFEGGDPGFSNRPEGVTVTYEYGGTFDVQLIGRAGDIRDTATYENIVVVKDALRVFPNPVAPFARLTIGTDQPITKVEIIGTDGKTYRIYEHVKDQSFEMPYLRSGVYTIRVNETMEKKLLVL